MPIGIVTDAELESELNKHKPVPPQPGTGAILDIPKPGRSEGDVNVPESLRKVIGETGAIEGHNAARQLASMFNISPSSTSAYTNGATSTSSYHKPNKDLSDHIKLGKAKVANRARIK